MMRHVVGVTLAAVVVSVRRGSARLDALGDEDKVPEVMDSIFSMVEKHAGQSSDRGKLITRSLQEMAMVWTNGTTGTLSEVVTKMQQDVLSKITKGHDATQDALNAATLKVTTRATHAATSKASSDALDNTLQICIQGEKEALQTVVTSQNVYNVKTDLTKEPCSREKTSAHFGTSSDGPISADCDTDADPTCAEAMKNLDDAMTTLKSKMSDKLTELANEHKQAETDCSTAVGVQSEQLEAVKGQQLSYHAKRADCAVDEGKRDAKICDFGGKLQDVCEAKSEYDKLVEDTGKSGNIHSVADRISESEVTQLVVCLLDGFVKGTDITDAVVKTCQEDVKTSEFDLDLKATDVATSLNVPSSPTFTISCLDKEAIKFHGGEMTKPDVLTFDASGYTAHEISSENQTLSSYGYNEVWTLPVSLTADSAAFALAQCADDPNDPMDAQEPDGNGK